MWGFHSKGANERCTNLHSIGGLSSIEIKHDLNLVDLGYSQDNVVEFKF